MTHLPDKFIQTILGVHRKKGELWLNSFSELIEYCQNKWSFQVLTPYSLSYNYVAPVVLSDGSEAVLKLGVPSLEIIAEIKALQQFNGNGIARLIDSEAEKGILLLERVKPGETLKTIINDESATLFAAEVMRKIKKPAPQHVTFPTTSQWATGFIKLRAHYNGGTGPIPDYLVSKAEITYTKLNGTLSSLQLLHGDLHHENILAAEREPWLAIDPKGVIGEPEYEVISFLMNHLPEINPIVTINHRVDIFVSELQLNKERVLSWALCHAVLSAWWHIESKTDGLDNAIKTAFMFEMLLNAS